MDDVVQAAMERSRWLEDWLGQAAAHEATWRQVTAPLQEQVLRQMNAAGRGRVRLDPGSIRYSDEQRRRGQAAMEARDALLARIRDRLRSGPDEERRAAAIYLLTSGQWWWHPGLSFNNAAGTADGWTAGELRAALRLLARAEHLGYEDIEVLGTWTGAAARLDDTGRGQLVPALRAVAARLSESPPGIRIRGRVLGQLTRLLRDLDPAVLPDGLLVPEDNWAPPLLEIAGKGDGDGKGSGGEELAGLVAHLSALSGPRPGKKWRTECLRLLRPDRVREFVVAGLRGLAECEPASVTGGYPRREYRAVVCEQNSLVARGVVWAAALLGEAGAVAGLAAVALRTGGTRRDIAQEFKVAGAAINALGESADPAALEALWTLQSRIRHRSLRAQLGVAVAAAAQRQGISPAELTERSVPDHGLGPDGTLVRDVGQHTAAVTIEGSRTARLTFRAPDGRVTRGVPAPVAGSFPGETAELKTLVRQVRSTLAAECRRLESLLSAHRTWPFGVWKRCYLNHPVTGAVARELIWELERAAGEWASALPGRDGRDGLTGRDGLAGADGRDLPVPAEDARVRLWHPARASAAEVRRWRSALTERRLRQPFRQAFREIYQLTPAEELAGDHSGRFAGHVVAYPALYALLKQRDWRSNFLGPFDGGDDGDATVELMAGQWRAHFRYRAIDPGVGAQVALATTGQVSLGCRDGKIWRPAALRDVPPLVFSEAMRDVDLFVSVTSIGADPERAGYDEDPYRAYWLDFASGELPPSAQVRRAALERLVPKLRIADRCSLTDRHLVVRGRLATYKIHIGSANVLMEPGSIYLCIVAGRPAAREKVFLPFEEDGRLAVILSKALLLADDESIDDDTIRRQIARAGAR